MKENSKPKSEVFSSETRPKRSSVTDQIKDFILTKGLKSGDLMPTETEICAELGVSRSSVREAIRTLAALDIVEVRHGYGTYVGQLSLAPLVEGLVFRGVLRPQDDFAALREVIEVREALDIVMAPQIIAALDGTTDEVLEDLVSTMVAKSQTGTSFAEEDLAFHTQLLAYLDNTLVGQLVTAFWEINTVLYPKLGISPAIDIDETARAHGAMLAAAKTGDLEAYRAAVVAHYQPLRRSLAKAAQHSTAG